MPAITKETIVHKPSVSPNIPVVTLPKLRKIALAQQGLIKTNPYGTGLTAVESCIAQIGYVQIDTISVVERAHHHVLWSRVNDYSAEHLATLVASKKVFEYWFHAAAFLPIQDFRFALPRMNAIKAGEKHWFENIDKKLVRNVYKRIETEGPLRARDFADTRKQNTGWWDWKPAKQALEKLFMQGDLMVVAREGFQKRYDLTTRVLPSSVDTRTPNISEQAKYLVDTTIRAHGFAGVRSFSYLRKGKELRVAIKQYLDQSVEDGLHTIIQTPACDQFYIEAKLLDKKLRASRRVRFLSPFDNLVIQRERGRQVFNFDYQIECYVPAPKRLYGYFCLPILYADNLVGRIDCKAHRKTNVLQVLFLQHEIESDEFIKALVKELTAFMKFNQCESIAIERTSSAKLRGRLKKLLNAA